MIRRTSSACVCALLGICVGPFVFPGLARAQTTETGPRPQSNEVETVIVTGQKRVETLDEVPTTVSVYGADILQRNQVKDLQGLNKLVPGYQFEMGAGNNMTLSIRGVGTTSSAQALEQSVSPYLNGVYLGGNNRDFSWPLYDLERIEVYKGTQSGIEGQNTSVGVVDITTTKPGSTFGGYLTASGEVVNDGYRAEGAVDVPVGGDLKLRLSGYYSRRGGWVHNVATGNDLGQQDSKALRLNSIWDISDRVHLQVYAEYADIKVIGNPVEINVDATGGYARYVAPFFTWSPNLGITAARMVNFEPTLGPDFGGDAGAIANTLRGSAILNVDLGGGYTLTSTTAASRIHDSLSVDQDLSTATIPTAADPTQVQVLEQKSHYSQVTEEVRLTSPPTDRLNYIVGLWYRHADYNKTTAIFVLPAPGLAFNIHWPYSRVTDNMSVFGDVRYALTDAIKVGGTLRYTSEDKPSQVEGTGNFPSTFPPFPLFKVDIKDNFWDGSVHVQYQPASGVNLYALYSHGTKTGALIDLVASGKPQIIEPEIIQTYEVGAKLRLIENTLDLALSAFHMPIKNYQDSFTAARPGGTIFVASSTDGVSNGVDATAQWRPTRGLTLGASTEYLQAKDLTNGGTSMRSPRWQGTANARYEFPLPNTDATVAIFGNVQYKGLYYNYPNGNVARISAETPAYTLADIGAEITLRNLRFSVLCKNCTDKHADVRAQNGTFGPTKAPTTYDFIPELRTVTIEATYRY